MTKSNHKAFFLLGSSDMVCACVKRAKGKGFVVVSLVTEGQCMIARLPSAFVDRSSSSSGGRFDQRRTKDSISSLMLVLASRTQKLEEVEAAARS